MKTVHWIHQGEETHQRKCSHTNNNNKKEPREKDPDRPSRCVTHLATTHTQQMNTPFSLLDLLQAVLFLLMFFFLFLVFFFKLVYVFSALKIEMIKTTTDATLSTKS
jgi:hypothetical protein